ncbi:hypothetical protein KJ997_00345, partial [bacterium]|nr:hypothetical protein [bacterium]
MGCLSRYVPIMAFFLLAFSIASAQSTPIDPKKPLALKECIQIAMDNSSKITIAKRSLTMAEI